MIWLFLIVPETHREIKVLLDFEMDLTSDLIDHIPSHLNKFVIGEKVAIMKIRNDL